MSPPPPLVLGQRWKHWKPPCSACLFLAVLVTLGLSFLFLALPAGAAETCAAATDCNSCATAAGGGCGFCKSTGRCMPGDSFGAEDYSCPTIHWQFGESACPVSVDDPCAASADCGSCQSQPQCGWCPSSRTCRTGDATGPTGEGESCAAQWTFGPEAVCLSCKSLFTCKECSADAHCAWCSSSGSCVANVEFGEAAGSASSEDWAAVCPGGKGNAFAGEGTCPAWSQAGGSADAAFALADTSSSAAQFATGCVVLICFLFVMSTVLIKVQTQWLPVPGKRALSQPPTPPSSSTPQPELKEGQPMNDLPLYDAEPSPRAAPTTPMQRFIRMPSTFSPPAWMIKGAFYTLTLLAMLLALSALIINNFSASPVSDSAAKALHDLSGTWPDSDGITAGVSGISGLNTPIGGSKANSFDCTGLSNTNDRRTCATLAASAVLTAVWIVLALAAGLMTMLVAIFGSSPGKTRRVASSAAEAEVQEVPASPLISLPAGPVHVHVPRPINDSYAPRMHSFALWFFLCTLCATLIWALGAQLSLATGAFVPHGSFALAESWGLILGAALSSAVAARAGKALIEHQQPKSAAASAAAVVASSSVAQGQQLLAGKDAETVDLSEVRIHSPMAMGSARSQHRRLPPPRDDINTTQGSEPAADDSELELDDALDENGNSVPPRFS